jgi:hypothetical protein
MSDITTVEAERTNLDLHVDLCAQRYTLLEKRLETVEAKVDSLGAQIQKSSSSISTVIITSAGTVVCSILGLIGVILMKM